MKMLYYKVVAALIFVCGMVDCCSVMVTVDPSIGVDCTSDLTVAANQSVCRDLNTVLNYVASLGTMLQPIEDCIEINIMPGDYVITSALHIRVNLILSAASANSSRIQVTFEIPVNQSSEPLYVLLFANIGSLTMNGINFSNSPGILGFENVTYVTTTNCSFSCFIQGAVEIYNCANILIQDCLFENNGPANIIKSQKYLGQSGGLSIGYNYDSENDFNPIVHISNSAFINNSVMTGIIDYDEAAIRNRLFPGRGGGASIIANSLNAIYATIEWCYFKDNSAQGYGGGLYIVPSGQTNHTCVINNTKFINNRSPNGGGIHMGFLIPGTLNRAISILIYNTEFTANYASHGGGANFLHTNYIQIAGEVGNHGLLENCTFLKNTAANYGAAVAVTSHNLYNTQERITAFDIINCTFTLNTASNKAGVVGVSYFPLTMQGSILFILNSGSALTVVGTVVYIIEGSHIQVINNTNHEDGSAFNLESLGQIVLYDNVLVKFIGNIGRFGAAINKESLRFLPESYYQQIYNPLCFMRHIESNKSPITWENDNISIIYENNIAVVGAAIYGDNAALCSWIQLQEPYFNSTLYFRTSAMTYRNNQNTGHAPNDYDSLWDIQTPPVTLIIQNQLISAYPGESFVLKFIPIDEFGNPTISVIRLLNSNNTSDSKQQVPLTFSKNAASIYKDLSMATFQTSFSNGADARIINSTVEAITIFTPHEYTAKFYIAAANCPSGTVLGSPDPFRSCVCNYNNTYITECRGLNIIFTDGFWASRIDEPGEFSDYVIILPCPIGYCRCTLNNGICETSTDFINNDNQCNCLRTGVLCGDCINSLGVSALLHQCVSCSAENGLIIGALVIIDAVIFILLLLFPFAFPSWLYSCLFYIQLLPILTEHFPVTFTTIHPYLYYVSSALSFYFVYDFCLYPNMSALVSYFIRFLPLFTAIIVCPIILVIRWYKFKNSHRSQWHGVWWIALLMYTHTVYTSASILNCPRFQKQGEEFSNIWYINGNIECFSGWHIPLAMLAIVSLLICASAIPITFVIIMSNKKNWNCPSPIQHCIRNLAPALTDGIKDDVQWFCSVDLLRRMVTILFIVALPRNEYSSIFFITLILFIYGYIQPYKSLVSNVLEVVLAIDVLILLALKNSNQIPSTIQTPQPNNTVSTNYNCTGINDIQGISPVVAAVTPFYYIPLVITVLGGVMWVCLKLRQGFILLNKRNLLATKISKCGWSLQSPDENTNSSLSLSQTYITDERY